MAIEQGIALDNGTIWNIVSYLFAGTNLANMREELIMPLPITWYLILIMGPYLVCGFPFQMYEKYGAAQMLSLGSKHGWWVEKLVWTIFYLFLYSVTIVLGIVIFCLHNNIIISTDINLDIFDWLYACQLIETVPDYFWFYHLGIAPVLLLITLTCIQMMFSQILGPMGGFGITAMYLGAAMVNDTPWLIGNYGMILRDKHICETGLDGRLGLSVYLSIGLFCILMWFLIVGIKDYNPRIREEI